MKVIARAGIEEVAWVYLGDYGDGRRVEFVESLQPPIPREEKWVLLVSTLLGCPVGCPFCDAGGDYAGMLSAEEVFQQIDYPVRRRYPSGSVPAEKWKIQFARMGEPALNPAVLTVLDELPSRYDAPGLLPSLSTVAPASSDQFFRELLAIKRRRYSGGRFQLQFSLHTTDDQRRDELVPVKKWSFGQIADYASDWYEVGDRKVTLNFALAEDSPLDPTVLLRHFSPERFLLKITPLNPTFAAKAAGLSSYINPDLPDEADPRLTRLREAGYRVLLSIGEREEDRIGSNCGQYIRRYLADNADLPGAYDYSLTQL